MWVCIYVIKGNIYSEHLRWFWNGSSCRITIFGILYFNSSKKEKEICPMYVVRSRVGVKNGHKSVSVMTDWRLVMQDTLYLGFSHCFPSAPLTLPNIFRFQEGTGCSRCREQWSQYSDTSGSSTQPEGLLRTSWRLPADANRLSRAAERAKNQSHLSQLRLRIQDVRATFALTTPTHNDERSSVLENNRSPSQVEASRLTLWNGKRHMCLQ